jgi:phosphoglycerate dehydrogenase-like enzyme
MSPTVLVHQLPVDAELFARLEAAAPGFSIVTKQEIDDDDVADAEVIAGHLSAAQLERAHALRWNHIWTAGADADLSAAMRASHAVLTSSAGNGAIPLAEQAVLLMLMLDRKVTDWLSAQAAAVWAPHVHGELNGRTVGIVGLGHVGQDLARKCRAFHMRVLALRQRPEIDPPDDVERVYGPAQFHEFLGQCDFVVVTAPLTSQTRGMFDRAAFDAMRSTAMFINVSRGEISDPVALLDALRDARIAGAGLDAHPDEPLAPDAPWWNLPNVIVTPHNGATTPQTRARGVEIFIENLCLYAKGLRLRNVVDKTAGYSTAPSERDPRD